MKPFFSLLVVNSEKIFSEYRNRKAPLSENELKRYLFVQARDENPWSPDYIYKNALEDFWRADSLGGLLQDSLTHLGGMLSFRGDGLYVRSDAFEAWQNTLLLVSPVVLIAHAVFQKQNDSFRNDATAMIRANLAQSTLPCIYEPVLETLVASRSLIETHMHLNGTSETDFVWQDALKRPLDFYRKIRPSFRKNEVLEQYLQIGETGPEKLYRILREARMMRDWMIARIMGLGSEPFAEGNQSFFPVFTVHPYEAVNPNEGFRDVQYEALFLVDGYRRLAEQNDEAFAHILHHYLLAQGWFIKLLVQQKKQVGFDQFQKITVNELREQKEKEYHDRFVQLRGFGKRNDLAVLEGRFAPKESREKLQELLRDIIGAYEKEKNKNPIFDLKLVCHFVKEKDKRKPKEIITFRDLNKRLDNRKRMEILLSVMERRYEKDRNKLSGEPIYGKIKDYVCGFDAAANELHARPEVFAPVFRHLAFLGHTNFTFHAGEDYVHLLSGMRTIYEAVVFLEMIPGNRIGHATAIGIDPRLWKKRIGENRTISIEQGEWLDNLVFAYSLLINIPESYPVLYLLEAEIKRLFNVIYDSFHLSYSMHDLMEGWLLRKYDPLFAFGWREPSIFDSFESGECKRAEELKKNNPRAFHLFEMYHESAAIEAYKKIISVAPDEILSTEMLRVLQDAVIRLLNEKNIAIESPPTSNVRISFYKEYAEHHIMRWLGLDGKDGPIPSVVIGSDDPGIFATALKNEYAHIYQLIEEKKGKSLAESMLYELHRNSKKFIF